MNHCEAVSLVRGVADLLRDSFKRGKSRDVIFPPTALRRIDSILLGPTLPSLGRLRLPGGCS